MKLRSIQMASFLVASALVSQISYGGCGGAIGWKNPGSSDKPIKLSEVLAASKSKFNVDIKESDLQSMCSSDKDFDVLDSQSKQLLGVIPVPGDAVGSDDGRALDLRLQQLLLTSRTQLVALHNARNAFYDDTTGLEEELQLSAYVPNALPIEDRTANNGLDYFVIVTIGQHCSAESRQSPFTIYGKLAIKTIEYIPGRIDYSSSTIYQKGDIRRTILANDEVMSSARQAASDNASYCRDRDSSYDLTRAQWASLQQSFQHPNNLLLADGLQKFMGYRDAGRPVSAYMLN